MENKRGESPLVALVSTVAFLGLEARAVEVQVQVTPGLPAFVVVGLADKAVAESRERVRGALSAIGLSLPPKRIVANLSPADLPKNVPSGSDPSRHANPECPGHDPDGRRSATDRSSGSLPQLARRFFVRVVDLPEGTRGPGTSCVSSGLRRSLPRVIRRHVDPDRIRVIRLLMNGEKWPS